jgi:hypothetical protein
MSKFTPLQIWTGSKANLLRLQAAYLALGFRYSLAELIDMLIKNDLAAHEEATPCDTQSPPQQD